MIDKNTFGDIKLYPILDYLYDNFDSLNKNERALLTKTLIRIQNTYKNLNLIGGINIIYDVKVDKQFIKNTAILHKTFLIEEIHKSKLPINFKTTLCNYLNVKFKVFTGGILK